MSAMWHLSPLDPNRQKWANQLPRRGNSAIQSGAASDGRHVKDL
jgi:hypothetical protein